GQITPHHQWRAEDGPESEKRTLFVVRKARLACLSPARSRTKVTQRQHVGIGPVPRLGERRPLGNSRKLIAQSLGIVDIAVPEVPDVVGNAPHLRILSHLLRLLDRSGARTETLKDGPSRLSKGLTQHANVVTFVRTAANAIGFDEIDTPAGIELCDRIVISLSLRF